MRPTYITAAVIAILLLVWLFSGELAKPTASPAASLASARTQAAAADEDAPRTRIRAQLVQAQDRTATVVVRGRTAAERQVTLRTEVAGRVVALPRDKGDRVAAGDLICKLADEDRPQQVDEAEQALTQARLELQGAQQLKARGLQSDTQVAQARARLASAEAALARTRLALANTGVRAPFAGVIGSRPVEVGDFLQPGATCATVLDTDPMLLVGEVAEQDVVRLALGMPVTARLTTGGTLQAVVTHIAPAPNAATRTFELEASINNPAGQVRAGLSADLAVAAEAHRAHRISSALLALDDRGNLGVRILDDNDRVQWTRIKVIGDEPDGHLWVTGLPDLARLITVGQELVVPGEQVEVEWQQAETPSAVAPAPATPDASRTTAAAAPAAA